MMHSALADMLWALLSAIWAACTRVMLCAGKGGLMACTRGPDNVRQLWRVRSPGRAFGAPFAVPRCTGLLSFTRVVLRRSGMRVRLASFFFKAAGCQEDSNPKRNSQVRWKPSCGCLALLGTAPSCLLPRLAGFPKRLGWARRGGNVLRHGTKDKGDGPIPWT